MAYTMHVQSGAIVRDSDGKTVAPCESTTDADYVAYVEWVNAGNSPRILDYLMPPVPVEVSMRQAQQALLQVGILDTVEQVVAQADRAVQIDWHKGQTVRRDWPALTVVQSLLGMTNRQIDELFILAGSL